MAVITVHYKKENKIVKLYLRKDQRFIYGNCAISAICMAFGQKSKVIEQGFRMIGSRNPDEGVNFYQINKLTKFLAAQKGLDIEYVSNKKKEKFYQIAVNNKDKNLLINLNNHLCFIKKGVIYDSYIGRLTIFHSKPLGYWVITRKPKPLIWAYFANSVNPNLNYELPA